MPILLFVITDYTTLLAWYLPIVVGGGRLTVNGAGGGAGNTVTGILGTWLSTSGTFGGYSGCNTGTACTNRTGGSICAPA